MNYMKKKTFCSLKIIKLKYSNVLIFQTNCFTNISTRDWDKFITIILLNKSTTLHNQFSRYLHNIQVIFELFKCNLKTLYITNTKLSKV